MDAKFESMETLYELLSGRFSENRRFISKSKLFDLYFSAWNAQVKA